MNPLAFFRSPAAQHLLERAARCAATPLSLHFVDEDREGTRILGWGQCAACAYIHNQPNGPKACADSRLPASTAAAKRGTPVPFVCHMGFVNLSVAALSKRQPGFVLTFGPYVPTETAGSLEHDALEGVQRLKVDIHDDLPFTLDDIHRASAEAIPEIAAWTAEALTALWDQFSSSDQSDPSDPSDQPTSPKRLRRPQDTLDDPYQSAAIAAAISSGALPLARELAQATLAEGAAGKRSGIAARRARAVAIAAAVLEACERARVDTTAGWNRFFRVVGKTPRAKTSSELLEWIMGIVGTLCWRSSQPAKRAESMGAFNRLVESHLTDGITLAHVAAELGENPTTITRRLQRDFGVSFSQYVGRLRIEKAKELLRRTQLPISAIAQRVGLSDVSNFGKLFRKFEGMAPLDYRKRYRDK
ncbi:MAG: helix-turn-helix domain-containing protein [Candidatus Hydrogenedentes bacterium]|nr:helix-turn-helix domain-containing protein [Candidatus Hydrogenedentota bacterium]